MLCHIVLFFHIGLLENEIPALGMPYKFFLSVILVMHYADPAAFYFPNVGNIDGLMNLLSTCVLVVLFNVLDFRTYWAPTQEDYQKANKNQQILINHDCNTIPINERFAICYSRGRTLHSGVN